MHGAGNDYVYIDGFNDRLPNNPSEFARTASDRHTGIGSDGLILICPTDVADAEMKMFNADGSESEMCGNGIRCVAKYLYDRGLVSSQRISIATGAGPKTVDIVNRQGTTTFVRVDMGQPLLEPEQIPTTLPTQGRFVHANIAVANAVLRVTCVSMGNPHCVVFKNQNETVFSRLGVDSVVHELGPLIETHKHFPSRTNVEFVEIDSPDSVRQRTWERGSGETLACGTGASAVCVAGVLTGKTDRKICCDLKGGRLEIEWDESTNHVFMTGPAVEVFHGEIGE